MKRRSSGFTLIELMVTVSILAVLLAIGVPSFKSLIATQKIKTAAADLQAFLNLTRAEALKRNASVTLSPNQSGQWNSGWKIIDPATGAVLFTSSEVATVSIVGPASVVYQGSGRVNATADGMFALSSAATTNYRCVEVDLSGIAVVTSSGC